MIAHLTKSYKVSRKIAHRNAMLVDQLAAQAPAKTQWSNVVRDHT
jgi:hypothetical protein